MSLRAETLPPFLVVVLLLCIRAYGDDTDSIINPTVNTTLGLIRGVRAEDGDYYMFMGIPFAQVNMSNPFGVSLLFFILLLPKKVISYILVFIE